MRSYVYHPQIWLGVQPTENTHEGPSHQFHWLSLWCQWCPPRPRQGRCCTCLASTHQHHWTSRVLRSSHIPKSLHTWSVHLDHPSARAAQERHRPHMELHLWHCFWVDQGSHCQWYHPQVLQPSLPMAIQVDASQVGLGTALLQNGKPIAFASKALTKTEHQYANIEREMLAAVFGVERFHTYVYGQSFTIESDHKPLESISRKNLADTLVWLQCMMLHLQGYDFTIHYHPGKEMVIPDTLSWFSPWPGPDLPLDIAIHHARIMPDCKEAFQQAFFNDPEMRALADLIITGWPKDIKEVPLPLHPYWQHRETLTIKDGLVLQGEALMIPPAERERSLHQLHQFHQGITKSQLLTCGSFFWPSINKAIEEAVCQCEACTWFQSQNATAPLTPTPTPLHPWKMCATDIFMLEGIDHLVVGWLLLEDDLGSIPSTWPEQQQQGCLPAERDVFRAWHPWSPLLWQWPTICECPVHWFLYILGHHTQNLKSVLPTIPWICQGMHQVCQIHNPMSQIQQCQSTSCLTSTPSYTNRHQASISSRAVVPMPTQNNHSG